MTRKDYQLMAGVIANCQGLARGGVIDTVAARLADALEQENPRFNRERFLTACGVKI